MTDSNPSSQLPAKALRQFDKAAKSDWGDGIPLAELLGRVNRVAVLFIPEDDGRGSRVKRLFTERSFRHYQTLGCIDPPERDGQRVVYGFRHFVQALLVRKLLWERVPAERIAELMAGCSTAETKGMLFEGVEMVARQGGGGSPSAGAADTVTSETWERITVTRDIELHLRDDLPKPKAAELKKLLARVETALRRHFR